MADEKSLVKCDYKITYTNLTTYEVFVLSNRNISCIHQYKYEFSNKLPYFSYKKTDTKVGFFSLYSGDSMLRVKVGLVVMFKYTHLFDFSGQTSCLAIF